MFLPILAEAWNKDGTTTKAARGTASYQSAMGCRIHV